MPVDLNLPDARLGDLQPEHPGDRSTDHARERLELLSLHLEHDVLSAHPALTVCSQTQRDEHIPAEKPVVHRAAVASGEDVGVRRPLVAVDLNGPARPQFEAGRDSQLVVGRHPDTHQNTDSLHRGPVVELDSTDLRVAVQTDDLSAGDDLHPVLFQLGTHQETHVIIHDGHDTGQCLNHRDIHAGPPEGLGHLDPNVPAPDDHRLAGFLIFQEGLQVDAVLEFLHGKDPRQVDARQVGHDGAGPGGQDQDPVALFEVHAVLKISHRDGLCLPVDG
ncbi:MAG: hypothetical protein BWX71_02286 [Deltaproteobacteria bacterium ADurb.Bin072]|nr:MAG: hypothetical protein BWX71_02286 [Deltaproteobacteria bacterium ADurb.Bin072]